MARPLSPPLPPLPVLLQLPTPMPCIPLRLLLLLLAAAGFSAYPGDREVLQQRVVEDVIQPVHSTARHSKGTASLQLLQLLRSGRFFCCALSAATPGLTSSWYQRPTGTAAAAGSAAAAGAQGAPCRSGSACCPPSAPCTASQGSR